MSLFSNTPARGLAAVALFGAIALAGPLTAAAADSAPALRVAQAATTTPPPPTAAPAAPAKPKRGIEARIKNLHDALKITSDQESQWAAVADAMRDDSKAMRAVIGERRKNRSKMSAVDDLKSYQTVAETHVQGLQKLIPAFQTLYDSMSPDQKKNADTIFASHQRRPKPAAPAAAAPTAPKQ
jgi:periplasmic protein CpxP/Spy